MPIKSAHWSYTKNGDVITDRFLLGPDGNYVDFTGTQHSGEIPRGLDWITDTLHGFDIYERGFVKTPTLYFDPSATTSLNRGTFDNPYNTQAALQAVVIGDMRGQVLGFKRGTTLRVTGTDGLYLDAYGTADDPFTICPYGDAEALPIITGGVVVTTFDQSGLSAAAISANIWKYSMGAIEHDAWQNDVRVAKKAWSTNAETTLTADGTSTYNSSTLYIRPYNGENPNLGQVEVTGSSYALRIAYSNVANTGNIIVAGMDVRKARTSVLAIGRPNTFATIAAVDNLQIVGCRVAGAGVDKSSATASDGIIVYGATDAIRATGVVIAGNHVSDVLNNSVEVAGLSGAVIEHNIGYNVGGYSVAELWSSNDSCIVRYNYGELASLYGKIVASFGAGGIWFANNYENGTNWDTTDATHTKNFDNVAHHNLIVNPQNRGLYASGGTGHKMHHNTVYMDSDAIYGAGVTSSDAIGWQTVGTAATGFCNISNNLFYWHNPASTRSPSMARINTTLGVSATVPAASIPVGDKNVYFTNTTAANGNFYYNGAGTSSFTTYKGAFDSAEAYMGGLSLDQNSFCGRAYTGSNLTTEASLGFDETTYTPLASAVQGLTTLTGIGYRYRDGKPYAAATPTIGCHLGS